MTEAISIKAPDGFELRGDYLPAGEGQPRGVVIINSATAVKRGYYRSFGRFLNARGFEVLLYDYRGIGESRPASLRGFPGTFVDWGQRDFPAVVDYAAGRWPGLPLGVVGHSIGGNILGMAANHGRISAAVTVGAQTAYFRDWPWPERLRLYLLWHGVLPLLTELVGYFPGRRLGILDDVPRGVIRQWHARRLNSHYEEQLRKVTEQLYYDQVSYPILAIGLADDPIGSPPAIDRLHQLFRRSAVERRIIQPADIGASRIHHFGFFRKSFADSLWPPVAEWLERELPAV